jgi:hypothetical protein
MPRRRRSHLASLPLILLAVTGFPASLPHSGSSPFASQAIAALAYPGETRVTPADSETLNRYAQSFRDFDTTLANPFFEGRAPGTRGNRLAAELIEFTFKRSGLTPLFASKNTDGTESPFSSYRQPFSTGQKRSPGDQALSATALGATVTFEPGKDFNVLGMSGAGKVSGKLAFAGYSLPKTEAEYNTYAGDEKVLDGKIAIVFRFEPMNDEGKSRLGEGGWSMRAGLEPKLRAAQDAGASAIILVTPPGADDPRADRLESVDTLSTRATFDVPVIMMSREAADRLVRAADEKGRSLADLRKEADSAGGVIDLSKADIQLAASITKAPIETDNVGAVLKGRGALADQYVVIGAHYDHLGYGGNGSMEPGSQGVIHPGADDNASGTSGVLTLAHELSEFYSKLPANVPARSIIFLTFSGEELGLIGSRFYCNNFPIPKEAHYAMLNMDMIGRLRQGKLEVGGVATGEGLEDFTKPYFEASGITVAGKPGGLGPSDHQSFFNAGIPVLFFFTGLHQQYHKPADVPATINNEGAAQIIDLVGRLAIDLAMREEPMPFADNDRSRRFERPGRGGDEPSAGPTAAAPPGAGPADPNAPGTGMRGGRVRFGIAPGDYSGSEKGVLVGDVFPGTSAAEAGLKTGDLMTEWNGTKLDAVEDWMPLLAKASPGDKVKIKYLREGKELETEATLKGRAQTNQ